MKLSWIVVPTLACLGSCLNLDTHDVDLVRARSSVVVRPESDEVELSVLSECVEAPRPTSDAQMAKHATLLGDPCTVILAGDRSSPFVLDERASDAASKDSRFALSPLRTEYRTERSSDERWTIAMSTIVQLSSALEQIDGEIRRCLLEPDARVRLERELPWLDPASRELWIARAARGDACVTVRDGRIELRLPLAKDAPRDALLDGAGNQLIELETLRIFAWLNVEEDEFVVHMGGHDVPVSTNPPVTKL